MNFLEWALRYAELGWAIFPCLPRQKVPATKHGVKDATTDEDQIRKWWGQWPSANIAVACGEPSGVHVVDVDVSETGSVSGWSSLVQLGQAGKILLPTIRQDTPRGGAHFFFCTDDPPANKNSFLLGIDIRSTGYYVVVAPSIHPNGGQYKWADGLSPWDRELAEYPDFMRSGEGPAPRQDAPLVPLSSHVVDSDILRRASAYLATCDPAIQGQGGHDKLLWAAVCLVHGFLLPDGQVYDLLTHEYNPRCEPPWDLSAPKDEKDFRRKLTEARKLVPKHSPGWLLKDSEYSSEPSMFTPEDLQNLIRSMEAKREPDELPALVQQEKLLTMTENAPDREAELRFLTQPTGLLGDLCSWINGCSRKPQPWLTLGCAISFLGVLFGRKVEDEDGLRTNIYCMGVARSSAGKNHAPKQIRRMCYEAGCSGLLGGDDFASDTSIESRLERDPATLFLCDEIGYLFSAIKGGKNPHTAKVVSLLMKLYSAADSVYTGREYADVEKRRTLVEPHCCVYGYSTPERFFDALTPEELQDGWLSRCLLFYSSDDPEKKRDGSAKKQPIPVSLTDQVNAWYARKLEKPEALQGLITPYTTEVIVRPPAPIIVPTPAEANDIFVAFDREAIVFGHEHAQLDCLWKKAEENARKIALIVAAGESFESPGITASVADYACRLARRLLLDFSLRAPCITENAIEKHKQRIIDLIGGCGSKGCLQRKVTMRTRWLHGRERSALLADLIESGEVIAESLAKTACYWTPRNYLIYRKGAT